MLTRPYYFTYGTSPTYPYEGGWTVVYAVSRSQAVHLFRAVHPDVREGTVNCADIYTQEQFEQTKMYKTGTNLGAGVHEVLGLSICPVSPDAVKRHLIPD